MKLRIYKYSIDIATARLLRLSSVLLFCIGLPSIAQQQQQRPGPVQKRDQKKKEVVVDTIPFYNGTYVGVDIYGIGSKMLGGDFMSSEISIGVNLKNKFIPTIEFPLYTSRVHKPRTVGRVSLYGPEKAHSN